MIIGSKPTKRIIMKPYFSKNTLSILFQSDFFSLSASFETGKKRITLLTSLLLLSYSILSNVPQRMSFTSLQIAPEVIRVTNKFDVANGCDRGTRECDWILIEVTGISSSKNPRVSINEGTALPILHRSPIKNAIIVERPKIIPKGPNRLIVSTEKNTYSIGWR